jgi:dTDP-4-dehydrorhamnose 3,5-epimerase
MQIKKTSIPDCYEIFPNVYNDKRGNFVKTFHQNYYEENNLVSHFAEEYYSFSYQGVLRGLHFQLPPHDHIKLVYCLLGEVMDVVLDLRVGSPKYGQYEIFDLNYQKANMIYVPSGLAHGYYVTSQSTIVMYKVTTVFSPKNDSGILWNSLGIPWPNSNPIISDRDQGLIDFNKFSSPFIFIRRQ